MATTSTSFLARRYAELRRAAEASGAKVTYDLYRGARIAVKVTAGVLTVSFSRVGVELGAEELRTFVRHCQIPDGAERIPAEGQAEYRDGGRTRYVVSYRWPLTGRLEGFEL